MKSNPHRCHGTMYYLSFLVAISGTLAAAAELPYAGLEQREVKALSAQQIEAYETGLGMGFALAAELNGYPGPKHVLELREALELSEDQWNSVKQVFDEMNTAAVVLGKQIVALERRLDQQFAGQSIDTDTLADLVDAIAELQGGLRAVHLQAHLRMKQILTAEQVASYVRLRGYQEHSAHPGHTPKH